MQTLLVTPELREIFETDRHSLAPVVEDNGSDVVGKKPVSLFEQQRPVPFSSGNAIL
ncbi:MAG: hypothetical protein WCF90_05785 [Methanomicrobiales archaeon]